MTMEALNSFCQSQVFHNLVIHGRKPENPAKNTWWEHVEAIQGRAAEAAIWQSSYAIQYLMERYPQIELVQPKWKQSEEGIDFDVLIQLSNGNKAYYSEYDTQPDEIPKWALDVDEGDVFAWAVVVMEEAITNTIYNTFEMATQAFSGQLSKEEIIAQRNLGGGHFEAAWQAHLLECATPKARNTRAQRRV
jgi:hypothetical protein